MCRNVAYLLLDLRRLFPLLKSLVLVMMLLLLAEPLKLFRRYPRGQKSLFHHAELNRSIRAVSIFPFKCKIKKKKLSSVHLETTESKSCLSITEKNRLGSISKIYFILKHLNGNNMHYQELITQSLHMCCTLESTLSSKELFLEQAFPRKFIVSWLR